jgi:hypothetical protein
MTQDAPILLRHVLLVVLAWQRGLSFWAFKSRRMETLSQGDVSILLKDGRLLLDGLNKALLSRERVMALLRVQGVEQDERPPRPWSSSLWESVTPSTATPQYGGCRSASHVL